MLLKRIRLEEKKIKVIKETDIKEIKNIKYNVTQIHFKFIYSFKAKYS
jgi:hypothetical protein